MWLLSQGWKTCLDNRDIETVIDATAALPAILGEPFAAGIFNTANDIKTFTHESRIVSDDGGNFDWLGGGFVALRNEKLDTNLIVDTLNPVGIPFSSIRKDYFSEAALFGELTYQFTSKFSVTVGARISRTEFDVRVASGGVANVGVSVLDARKTRTAVAPKAAISYQYSDDIMLNAQAAQGSRIGGFNVSTPLEAITALDPEDSVTSFESDVLWNTEVGLKSSWLDGDLVFNAAGFYVFWKDIQTDQILPNGFSFITNAGQAQNYGFEAEITARPTSRLELTSAFFWNEPQLTEANPFLGAEVGDLLPNIAELSASTGIAYEFPVNGQWAAILAADYNYVGKSFLTFAEETAPGMGDYHQGNVRITAFKENLRIGIYADNVSNTRSNTFAFGNPFSLATQRQETPLRPRTIGVFMETEF